MNEIQHIKTNNLLQDARIIIDTARSNAVHSVDFCRVQMYWNLGRRIIEEEQQGKERAEYGTYLIKKLAEHLETEYGSGFSERQLKFCRQFYTVYPIGNALRSQLNWSQYRKLIQIPDPDKREYYELESVNNAWNGRELERQINSHLYERLLLSNDKETLLAIARKERIPETPQEIIKDPLVLEFLGLGQNPSYYEKDIERAIISHITDLCAVLYLLSLKLESLRTKIWDSCRCMLIIMTAKKNSRKRTRPLASCFALAKIIQL